MWDDDSNEEVTPKETSSPDYLRRIALAMILIGFLQLIVEYTQRLMPSGLYFLLIPIGSALLGVSYWRSTHRPIATALWSLIPLLVLAAFLGIAA